MVLSRSFDCICNSETCVLRLSTGDTKRDSRILNSRCMVIAYEKPGCNLGPFLKKRTRDRLLRIPLLARGLEC